MIKKEKLRQKHVTGGAGVTGVMGVMGGYVRLRVVFPLNGGYWRLRGLGVMK